MVTFEVLISRLGAVLGGSVKNGASQISSVTFKGSETAMQLARKGAIGDAVKKAREEAKAAVAALYKRLGRPLHVQVIRSFFSRSFASSSFAGRFSNVSAAFPIVGGEQSVQASVSVTFALY